MDKIDKLIINSPYVEPQQYWEYLRESREFILQSGRRPAGHVVASENSKSFDDPGVFIEIDLVNQININIIDVNKTVRHTNKAFVSLCFYSSVFNN